MRSAWTLKTSRAADLLRADARFLARFPRRDLPKTWAERRADRRRLHRVRVFAILLRRRGLRAAGIEPVKAGDVNRALRAGLREIAKIV